MIPDYEKLKEERKINPYNVMNEQIDVLEKDKYLSIIADEKYVSIIADEITANSEDISKTEVNDDDDEDDGYLEASQPNASCQENNEGTGYMEPVDKTSGKNTDETGYIEPVEEYLGENNAETGYTEPVDETLGEINEARTNGFPLQYITNINGYVEPANNVNKSVCITDGDEEGGYLEPQEPVGGKTDEISEEPYAYSQPYEFPHRH